MDEARARDLLRGERGRIERALAALMPPPGDELSGDDQHVADQGQTLQEDALDEGLKESLLEQLAALERAEERLAEGTYGLSVESGEPIPDARLEVNPLAELTVAEEERRER